MLFLQTVLNGLVVGGIYSLAAVGFSLIFGVMGIVNLTHGVFVIAGAYGALMLWTGFGLDPVVSIIPVGIALFAFGYVYQRTIIHWAVSRASIVASLLVTFGVALVLRNLMQLWFSPDVRSITPAYSFESIAIGPLQIDLVRIVALGASLVLLSLLAVVLARTAFGRAIRATAQQPLAASLSGVDVRHVYARAPSSASSSHSRRRARSPGR